MGHPLSCSAVLPANQPVSVVFGHLQRLWSASPETQPAALTTELAPVVETIAALDRIARSGQQCYLVMDMLRQEYLYLSPNQRQLSGYDCAEMYAGGLAWVFGRLHPADVPALMHMFEAKWDFYQRLPEAERPDFRAHYDYRLRHADGRYRRMQQQSVCLRHTAAGQPHIILAQLTEITHLKPALEAESEKPVLLLTINTGGPDRLVLQCGPQGIVRRNGPLLTGREQQVLACLEQGLSSRAIAGLLGSSVATIDTQRRQMLRKTGVVDTTALVSYGRLLGWV